MTPHQEMAHRVLSTPRVTQRGWHVEVKQRSGAWTIVAYLRGQQAGETEDEACKRVRKLFPGYKSRQLRARAV